MRAASAKGETMEKELVAARKLAESAVSDMENNPLKVAAFQTILSELLKRGSPQTAVHSGTIQEVTSAPKRNTVRAASGGTTSRLLSLVQEGLFNEQRSLADIKQILSEKGWHYESDDLGTPVTRLVRRKYLRRTQVAEGGKKIWKYSNY